MNKLSTQHSAKSIKLSLMLSAGVAHIFILLSLSPVFFFPALLLFHLIFKEAFNIQTKITQTSVYTKLENKHQNIREQISYHDMIWLLSIIASRIFHLKSFFYWYTISQAFHSCFHLTYCSLSTSSLNTSSPRNRFQQIRNVQQCGLFVCSNDLKAYWLSMDLRRRELIRLLHFFITLHTCNSCRYGSMPRWLTPHWILGVHFWQFKKQLYDLGT